MARQVVTSNDILKNNPPETSGKLTGETSYQAGKDKYVDRLFKYIPSELVAGYIFVLGIVRQLTDPGEIRVLHWILFFIFCILTPLYLWRIQKVLKVQQHIISLLSFVVWVFALGGPFSLLCWYNPLYGEILLPIFTLAVAVWEAE